MKNLLICAVPTPGHTVPMRVVARHLLEQGYRVRFLAGRHVADTLRADGCIIEPLCPEADFDYLNPAFEVPDDRSGVSASVAYNDLPPGDEQTVMALEHKFAPAVPALHRQIDEIIRREEIDLVLCDSWFTGILPLLGLRRRPPVLIIGVTPFGLSSPDSMLHGPRIAPLMVPPSLSGRLTRTEAEDVLLERVQSAFDAACVNATGIGLKRFFMDEMILAADSWQHFAVPAFEHQREDLPAHVAFVGVPPCPPDRLSAGVPPWAEDDARPLVVVTQGTLANRDLQRVIGPTLEAAADLPVRVLATTGGREPVGLTAPENGWIVPFVPFDRWFAHTSVLVSNGGYGTVQYALARGVPLIIAGAGEDKAEVATRVAVAGCGIDLGTAFPTPDAIRNALLRVLERPGYRRVARSLARQNRYTDALDSVAREVHRLTQRPRIVRESP